MTLVPNTSRTIAAMLLLLLIPKQSAGKTIHLTTNTNAFVIQRNQLLRRNNYRTTCQITHQHHQQRLQRRHPLLNHQQRCETTRQYAVQSRKLRFYNSSPSPSTFMKTDTDVSRRRSSAATVATPTVNNGMSAVFESLFNLEKQYTNITTTSPILSLLSSSVNVNNVQQQSSFSTSSTEQKKNSKTMNKKDKQTKADDKEEGSGGSGGRSSSPTSPTGTIELTKEEAALFELLKNVSESTSASTTSPTTTLRVAGGWVRDKLLATDRFKRRSVISNRNDGSDSHKVERLTSKFKGQSNAFKNSKLPGGEYLDSSSVTATTTSLVNPIEKPVDVDVALDDMLGREFADYLNKFLIDKGLDELSVGMVLQNPEKSKHLETATMKVGRFWIDFVNLRAEEYTNTESRIPDLMRIGTAMEDAFRRDLTINAMFYNINTGQVEDLTGRGFEHLKKGLIATPLPPLTTLLDDPLRVLRSVRFAARLRFTMEEKLRKAAMDERVRAALAHKVARERIGSEVDLMLRSQDPVGAMRLLINLNLVDTVFPFHDAKGGATANEGEEASAVFPKGLDLLLTTHNHLCDCKANTHYWRESIDSRSNPTTTHGVNEIVLINDDDLRRKLWYASFLKPLRDNVKIMIKSEKQKVSRRAGKKANRSAIMKLMVDELKRPLKDAEQVELIMKAADDFTNLLDAGCDLSATAILLGEIQLFREYDQMYDDVNGRKKRTTTNNYKSRSETVICQMGNKVVDCDTEDDPLWLHAMEYRLLVSKVLGRVGPLWRAAVILSLSEKLLELEKDDLSYAIEGDFVEETHEKRRLFIIQKYDTFAASMVKLGLIGTSSLSSSSWEQQPMIDGNELGADGILPNITKGPIFREIMNEQISWMTTHPGGKKERLIEHLREVYPEFVDPEFI